MTSAAESVKRLAVPLVLLFVFQFLHGLAPAPEGVSDEGGITGFVGGIGFLLATGVAAGAAFAGRAWALSLGRFLGLTIPIGFVLYHGSWFTSPFTNPYWGDGSATGWQWATLPPVMLVGLWVAALASRTGAPERASEAVAA